MTAAEIGIVLLVLATFLLGYAVGLYRGYCAAARQYCEGL